VGASLSSITNILVQERFIGRLARERDREVGLIQLYIA
jgi:hypothetical protein